MTPDDLLRHEKALVASKYEALAKGEVFLWVVTRHHLFRQFRDLPAEQVGLKHVHDHVGVQIYDRIEFHDEGRVFILKNRKGPCGEVVPGAGRELAPSRLSVADILDRMETVVRTLPTKGE